MKADMVTIGLRVSPSDKALLQEAAKIQGKTLSQMLREVAEREAMRLFPNAAKPIKRRRR